MSQRRLNASIESSGRIFGHKRMKGRWQGHQELIFCPTSLSIFRFICFQDVSLFSTSLPVDTIDFCWLTLFLFLQKHVFMNKTPNQSQNNSSHNCTAALTVFLEKFFFWGEKHERNRGTQCIDDWSCFFFYINGYLEYKRENPKSIGHCDCNLKDNVDIVLSTGSVYFKRTVANLFE